MRHLLRRVIFYVAALWASVTINFILPRLMPGDPIQAYVANLRGQGNITEATLQALRVQFGLSDAPLPVQYFQYLTNLLQGKMGVSISHFPSPVLSVIASDIPWTLGLVGTASVISFLLGTLLGVLVSWRRGSLLDTVAAPLLTFFSAIPYFWLALGLIYLLAFRSSFFPLDSGYDTTSDIGPSWDPVFIAGVIQHAILPAATIVISSIAGWMLSMRNSMITTLSEDYVHMARAKGLSDRRVMMAYASRNAILPSITGFSMSLGYVVGGSLLTEMVFSYPGVGFDLFNAIHHLDYSLIQGIFLFIALAMLAANFISEIVYMLLDPRVRNERG
jgi:peptide/nickel transport system permease protein